MCRKDWLKHKATCWPIETTTEVSSKQDRLAVKELLMRKKVDSLLHSLHAFRSKHQVRCSRHSMADLQSALSQDHWGTIR